MKTALITGAHGDIGFSIAKRLSEDKWNLILLSKHKISTTNIKTLENLGSKVSTFEIDFLNKNIVKSFFEELKKEQKRIDVLINNAGVYPIVSFEKYTDDLWDLVIEINLSATFRCIKYALPFMKHYGGRIVNISSTGAHLGSRDPAYSASKAGQIGLTKSLARSLSKYNILVNAVAPGMIDTRMSRRMKTKDRQKNIENSLVKRAGNVNDVAGAVSFLLSEDASYITGSTIDVNGGLYIR